MLERRVVALLLHLCKPCLRGYNIFLIFYLEAWGHHASPCSLFSASLFPCIFAFLLLLSNYLKEKRNVFSLKLTSPLPSLIQSLPICPWSEKTNKQKTPHAYIHCLLDISIWVYESHLNWTYPKQKSYAFPKSCSSPLSSQHPWIAILFFQLSRPQTLGWSLTPFIFPSQIPHLILQQILLTLYLQSASESYLFSSPSQPSEFKLQSSLPSMKVMPSELVSLLPSLFPTPVLITEIMVILFKYSQALPLLC